MAGVAEDGDIAGAQTIANLRESYAATGYASLEWSEERERAIDRVAAAGNASVLGVNIWRARYMLESAAYVAAVAELESAYRARHPREQPAIVTAVVEQSMLEFVASFCPRCLGTGEDMVDSRKVVCYRCQGSRQKRYSDEERARRMSVSMQRVKSLQRGMSWMSDYIGKLDAQVNEVIAFELERC